MRTGISFVIVDAIYCRSKLSNSQKLLDQNKVCYYLNTYKKSEIFKFTIELPQSQMTLPQSDSAVLTKMISKMKS